MSELGRVLVKLARPNPQLVVAQKDKVALPFKLLGTLGAVTKTAMQDELQKLNSAPISFVSPEEVNKAREKLRELKEQKLTPSDIARGAMAGGTAGTAALLAKSTVTGDLARGVGEALKAPTVAGKIGRIGVGALKGVGGTMAGSAAFGATLPAVRDYLNREAAKEKIRQYTGSSRYDGLRGKVKKELGI